MIGNDQLPQPAYRQTNPQIHKYPPPLIPVRHLNGGMRFDAAQNHYPSQDVVDLSATTRYFIEITNQLVILIHFIVATIKIIP